MTVLGSIAIALALWVGPPPAPGGSPAKPERSEPAAERSKPAAEPERSESPAEPKRSQPAAEPERPEPAAEPERSQPTAEPERPEPTAEPEGSEPTAEPERPEPTAEPERPEPTAEPERPEPTAEPERPEPPAPSLPGPAAGAGQAAPGSTASVDDSPIAVTTRLEPDPSNIGDALEYQVVVGYPRGYSVNLPSVVDVSPLHLVEVAESEPEATGDGLRKTFTLRLQYFDVGEAAVPSFPLTYVDPDGAVQTRTVPAHAFTVEALLANEADPQRRGEDPPISIEYPNTLAETIIWSTLGTLLALAVLVPVIRRLWGRRTEAPLPPPIPPHELAYEALRELEQGDLIAEQRYLDYYLQLTEIGKGYLEGRFGVPALDRTTEEIRRTLMLRGDSIAPLSPDEVVAFLQSCDLVKFARFTPDVDEAKDALTTVRTMVDRTVPAAAKTGAAGAKADAPANDEPGASNGSSEGGAAEGEAAKAEAAKGEAAKGEAAKGGAARGETAKGATAKGATARGEAAKGEAAKGEAAKGEAARGEAAKGEAAKGEASKAEVSKAEAATGKGGSGQAARAEASRAEAAKAEAPKDEAAKAEASRAEAPKAEAAKAEAAKSEAAEAEASEDRPTSTPSSSSEETRT